MRPRCLLRRRSSYMTSRQLCCVFHYFLASVKHQTCLGSSSPLGKKRKMPGIFFIFYFFSSPLKVSMTLLIHLAISRARCAVGVMSLTLPTYKTSPVCICDSKNTLSVFVFKHADERWPLELVFKMFCQGTELLFRRKLFKCFVEISPHTSSTNKWSLFMTSSSFLCFPCLSMSSCFSLPLISVRPSLPPPALFISSGTQCQLRGRPVRAGVPVQGAGRDGSRDGPCVARAHAAVRGQGELRELSGTLPLNHAHLSLSVCLSGPPLEELTPSLTFCWCEFCVLNNNYITV